MDVNGILKEKRLDQVMLVMSPVTEIPHPVVPSSFPVGAEWLATLYKCPWMCQGLIQLTGLKWEVLWALPSPTPFDLPPQRRILSYGTTGVERFPVAHLQISHSRVWWATNIWLKGSSMREGCLESLSKVEGPVWRQLRTKLTLIDPVSAGLDPLLKTSTAVTSPSNEWTVFSTIDQKLAGRYPLDHMSTSENAMDTYFHAYVALMLTYWPLFWLFVVE